MSTSGTSDSSRPVETSPSSAEVLPGQLSEERVEFLRDRSPTPAFADCRVGCCPWCVVRGRHGHLGHALDLIERRRSLLAPEDGHGRFILLHCHRWLLELAEADAAGTLEPVDTSQGVPIPAAPCSVFPPGPSSSSTRGRSPPPPPPPRIPPAAMGRNKIPTRTSVALQEPAPTVPKASLSSPAPTSIRQAPPSDASAIVLPPHPSVPASTTAGDDIWEVWGGRSTKWIRYPAEVSRELSRMEAQGPPRAQFYIEGREYYIDVLSLEQNNPRSELKARQIRKRPRDEVE